MYKFNMTAFLYDNELSLSDLADEIGVHRSTISKAKDRGTVKPSFIKRLRKKKYNPDPYLGGKSK